jgi:hypothetical protein
MVANQIGPHVVIDERLNESPQRSRATIASSSVPPLRRFVSGYLAIIR